MGIDSEDLTDVGPDIMEHVTPHMTVILHPGVKNREPAAKFKCGCTNLIIEMIRRAIFDLTLGEQLKKDAESWLYDDEQQRPFSFCWICDYLGLDIRAVRKHAKLVADNSSVDGVRRLNCRKLVW